MGQRANLIIIENDKYSLYYSHWCANTLPRDLFWGAEHAIDFVRIQREVDESGWLDDVWAEGAAVIDCDNRVLLMYGGEIEIYDIPLRRVYLEMLGYVWSMWEVRWAYEGIADIADYVGYPRFKVLSESEDDAASSLSPPEEKDWTEIVGSFRLADGSLQIYPLVGEVEYYLFAGQSLLQQCQFTRGEESLNLDEWLECNFPKGGFHIDLVAQTVDYWTATEIPDIPNRVRAIWSGWNVIWHRDRYEYQLDATAGMLRFPHQSKEQIQAQLKNMLLSNYGHSPVDNILKIIEENGKEGKAAEVNPLALRDDRLEIDLSQRNKIFNEAMTNIQNRIPALERSLEEIKLD